MASADQFHWSRGSVSIQKARGLILASAKVSRFLMTKTVSLLILWQILELLPQKGARVTLKGVLLSFWVKVVARLMYLLGLIPFGSLVIATVLSYQNPSSPHQNRFKITGSYKTLYVCHRFE